MSNIIFLNKLEELNKTRNRLLEDLFEDDNIEKVEQIDKDIIKLKSQFFKKSLNWEEVNISISNYSSIMPEHQEAIYLPENLKLSIEYIDFKLSFSINNHEIFNELYIDKSFKLINEKAQIASIDNQNVKINEIDIPEIIKLFEIKVDCSFIYIFINSMEVFKTLKPSNAFSLTI